MGVMALQNRGDIFHSKYIFLPLLTCAHFYQMLTILEFITHDLLSPVYLGQREGFRHVHIETYILGSF
jgi:hypothetical protein